MIAEGLDAVSCDFLDSESAKGPHIQGDVLGCLDHGWDMLIAHPPCTRLCNSGVRWLHERDLWGELDEAADFFKALLNAPIPLVAVENPVMHRYARERIGRGPDFTVQPWQFGDRERKRTCFWTRGLPPLVPTTPAATADGTARSVHAAPPSPTRWMDRSRTFPGMAQAMAEQWGRSLLSG